MNNKGIIMAMGIDYSIVMERFAHHEDMYMMYLRGFCQRVFMRLANIYIDNISMMNEQEESDE